MNAEDRPATRTTAPLPRPEPLEYGDPPDCREVDCRSFPTWEAYTEDEAEAFIDYMCGRHLLEFLSDWVSRDGSSVTLTRRVRK